MGLLLYAVIVSSFAVWVTIHLRLCAGLGSENWKQGLVGLLVPPLALHWASRARIPRWPVLWVVSLACYLIALLGGFVF